MQGILIALHDVTIECVCTSAVKFCLRGTHSYIEVNVNLAFFLTAALNATIHVYSHNKKLERKFKLSAAQSFLSGVA